MRALTLALIILLAACSSPAAVVVKATAQLPPDNPAACELSLADAVKQGAVKMTDDQFETLKSWMSDQSLPLPPAEIDAYVAPNADTGDMDVLFDFAGCITVDLNFTKQGWSSIFDAPPKDPGI